MIAHTSSAAIRSGPPQRGASRKRSATVPRTPAPESHRARQALTVLRQIPSLSAVPSIPRPSPKSNTMRARIASCCGVKDARIRRSSPSRSSSLNSILAALRPISSLHREIIATENQTTENKSLICESELTPTCTSTHRRRSRPHTIASPVSSEGGEAKAMRRIGEPCRRSEETGEATRRAALRGRRQRCAALVMRCITAHHAPCRTTSHRRRMGSGPPTVCTSFLYPPRSRTPSARTRTPVPPLRAGRSGRRRRHGRRPCWCGAKLGCRRY